MKQLFFLLLFPAFAMAQYQGNSNQKITLGEQTTADGLVYRGVASIDTVTVTSKITRANKQDTSAYLLLDTVTNLLWHYKIGSNAWTQAGGGVSVSSFSAGTTGLTPSTATTGAVTLGGTLAVANGGTNTSTAFTAGSVVFAGANGTYSQDNSNLFWDNTNKRLGIGTNSPAAKLDVNGIAYFRDAGGIFTDLITAYSGGNVGILYGASSNLIISGGSGASERMRITSAGNVGIGTTSTTYKLQVGDLANTSGVLNDIFITGDRVNTNNYYARLIFGNSSQSGGSTASIRGERMDGSNFATGLTFYTNGTVSAGDGSERMRITSGGNVGIGTASPAATLDIISSGSIQTAILARGLDVSFRLVSRQDKTTNVSGSVIGEFGVDWTTTRNSAIRFHRGGDITGGFITFTTNDGSERMRITAAGDVGIGTISPQSGYKLHVVDSVYVGGNVSASAYTTRSDYDLKDEIQNISYGINEIMQMQPVKYTYKSNGSTQLGFIAQDLGVITPEVVSFEDKMSVYYNALIPILTKAIQEQQALIKALEQRLLILENK